MLTVCAILLALNLWYWGWVIEMYQENGDE